MAKMPKNAREVLNFEDIAAANLGFTLAQFAIDAMIKNNLLQSSEVAEFFNQVASGYERLANPERTPMGIRAAVVLRNLVAMKYSSPPKNRQN